MEEQHVYHHSDNPPTVNVKVIKNTKGFNYEATVTGARSVEEAMVMLTDAQLRLAEIYDTPDE